MESAPHNPRQVGNDRRNQVWRPGFVGSTVTRNSSWSAAFEGDAFCIDGRSYQLGSIARATCNRGKLFADVEIELQNGGPLILGGLTNRKAQQLVEILTLLPVAAKYRHRFSAWGDGLRWIPASVVAKFKRELPKQFSGIDLNKFGSRHVARSGRSSLTEEQAYQLGFLTGQSYNSEAERHNSLFMTEDLGRYKDFFETVEKNPLTPEQREAVITFDDNVMTVAAAGSGKTSVMVAKAGYAVESGLFKPEEIVLLAFNRDAADELADRVRAYLGPRQKEVDRITVSTFHSLGLSVIGQATGAKPTVAPWIESGQEVSELVNIVETLSKKRSFSKNWNLFKTVYATSLPPFGTREEPEWWDPNTGTRGFRTIHGETVKSSEEQLIANWLALQGIDYQYERPYEIETATSDYGQYHPDFWYPSADVYHEHFGVDKDGNPPDWFKPGYKEGMAWKRQLHEQNETTLIETTSHSIRQPGGFAKLQGDLERHGVKFDERPLTDQQREELTEDASLLRTFKTFMAHVKSNRLSMDDLWRRAKSRKTDQPDRDHLFLAVFEKIWEEWDRRLDEGNYVDFEDMLCKAVDHLAAGRCSMPYKLIMADEFQDSSRVRGALLKQLSKDEDARLFVVGDDWQAVNRFAGADISMMSNFDQFFGSSTTTQLTTTFRCPADLCEVAGDFVSKNPFQIAKKVRSVNARTLPSAICFKLGDIGHQNSVLQKHIRMLAEKLREEGESASAYILGRYRSDCPSNLLAVKEDVRDVVDLGFSTIHRAKGLEADYIFLVNAIEAIKGMPSKIADDSALWIAMPDGESYPFAEERRLFYVALTRAKKLVSVYTDFHRRSEFIAEMERDGAAIEIRYEGSSADAPEELRECPKCDNGVLTNREGQYGTFTGCSRFPKCDFTENIESKGDERQVTEMPSKGRKCPKCRKGTLAKRDGQFGAFFGCSRYPKCEFTEHIEKKCPKCRIGKIIVKEGQYGKFMSCNRYPRCKYTKSPRRRKNRPRGVSRN